MSDSVRSLKLRSWYRESPYSPWIAEGVPREVTVFAIWWQTSSELPIVEYGVGGEIGSGALGTHEGWQRVWLPAGVHPDSVDQGLDVAELLSATSDTPRIQPRPGGSAR